MATIRRCDDGGNPRYRLTITDIGDTYSDVLGHVEVCDACMAGLALLQPGIREIIGNKYKGDRHADTV